MNTLAFDVIGTPAPQGSKRHVGNCVMVESSKAVKPWRQDVAAAARAAASEQDWQAPRHVVVAAVFRFHRPSGHFGTGRNANRIRAGAPRLHTQKPDLDKLLRATLDALTTSGVIRDDANVHAIHAQKTWCTPGQASGAHIAITEQPTN